MTAAMLAAAAAAAAFSFGEVKVDCERQGDWKVSLAREVASDGAEVARLTLECAEAKVPPKTTLSVETAQVGSDYVWSVNESDCERRRGLM